MVCWWAENPNGDEFKHHLARVPDYLWLAEDGMKSNASCSQLWDCALASQAIVASGMVEEYGDSLKKAHFFIKQSQVFPLYMNISCPLNILQQVRIYVIAEFVMVLINIKVKENPSGDFESMCRKLAKGGWAFSDQDQGWVVSDCTAEALKVISNSLNIWL